MFFYVNVWITDPEVDSRLSGHDVKGYTRLLRSILVLLCSGCEDPTGAVLGCVIDMLVIMHVKVVDIPFVAQRLFPLVHLSRPLRCTSCSPLKMCSMSLLYRSSRFQVQSARRQSRSHSCSSFSSWTRSLTARCCATTVPCGSDVRKLCRSAVQV